jgi:hypothetical protein
MRAEFRTTCPPEAYWQHSPRTDGGYLLVKRNGNVPIASRLRFDRDGTVDADGAQGPWMADGQVSFEVNAAMDRYIGPIGPDSLHLEVWQHLASGVPVGVGWAHYRFEGD